MADDLPPPASQKAESEDDRTDASPLAPNGTDASVGKQAAKGVLWMTAQTWFARAGGLVTVAILARILAPEDFGVLAIASTLLTLTYVLSDLGLSTYVVQATEVDSRSLSTAFWVSLLGGIVLAVGILFGSPAVASLLRVPQSAPILQSMTVIVLLISLTSVPLALLRRRMQFRAIALQASVGAILAQVAAIVAAILGAGVWALVLQLVVGQVVASAATWMNARWRPTWEFSRSAFRVMSRFGLHVVGTGLVFLGRGWAETGIIAAGLGVRELGHYNIAQRLVQTATELSGAALHPVSTVAFAKLSESVQRLRAAHARAMAVSQAVVTPLMVYIAVAAPVLVPFLFGREWLVSAEVARPLAVAAALVFGTQLDHGLFDGVGRPGRWLAFITVVWAGSVALTAASVSYGVFVVASAFMVTAVVELVGRWFMVGRLLGSRVMATARPFLVVLPAALGSAGLGLGAMWLLRQTPALVSLGATGLVVLGAHFLLTRQFARSTWIELLNLVPGRFRRGTGKTAPSTAVEQNG